MEKNYRIRLLKILIINGGFASNFENDYRRSYKIYSYIQKNLGENYT